MALCTSCGNEVAGSASFCTSCGQRQVAGARAANPQPAAATSAVCSSCGAQLDASSAFCTACGQRRSSDRPAPPVETASAVAIPLAAAAASMPAAAPAPPSLSSATAFCTACGTKLEPGIRFCTGCGQPTPENSMAAPERTASVAPMIQTPEATQLGSVTPAPTAAAAAAPALVETAPEAARFQPAAEPVAQVTAPQYPAPSDYQPAQPASGGKFSAIVLVLLLIIVVGACGGWYFWGVETIIVSSPPGVTVFLDDKELAPESYGRYVIPHLSRKTHFLKVQRPGFADTIQRLDFPLTSLHEWVNIKLVPSRQVRPSSPR
jgi:hypothetical protein